MEGNQCHWINWTSLGLAWTNVPVSKGVLQRWGATRLEDQAIWHHLPEITTTDYSANTVIVTHSIRVLSEIFHPKGTPWRAGHVYKPTYELTHNNIRINICDNCLHNVHVCVAYSYLANV